MRLAAFYHSLARRNAVLILNLAMLEVGGNLAKPILIPTTNKTSSDTVDCTNGSYTLISFATPSPS